MVTRQQVIEMLKTNDKAVARALVALNARQTASEQRTEGTMYQNGEGFTPADARMGTNMANFYIKFNRLSEKQIAYWRKPNARGVPRICKYANQLVEIAQEKQKQKQTPLPLLSDIGNLMEEKIAIQEQIDAIREGAIELGPDTERRVELLFGRLEQIQEAVEEIKRCEYKMKDFV